MLVRFIDKTPLRRTEEAIMYRLHINGDVIYIHKGFFYDGASLPRLLRFLDDGKHELAYLKHDYGYSKKCQIGTRKDWDLELYNDIRGLSGIIIYLGVRIFGGTYWKKDANYHKYHYILSDL